MTSKYNPKSGKYTIKKENTTTYDEYYQSDDESQSQHQKAGAPKQITSLAKVEYQRPSTGTKQDKFTIEDIKDKIQGCISLKTIKEKQILTKLPLFKTWIKYFDKKQKKFRTGGLLMKVEYPKYITLVNTALNINWSVQLTDNFILYIPDGDKKDKIDTESEDPDIKKKKEKLYELYQQGRVKIAN